MIDFWDKVCYNYIDFTNYIAKKGRTVLKKKEKKSFFSFFDLNRANRADAVEEDKRPTIKRYFKVLGRRFWQLISLNLMMLPLILPVILIVYLYFGIDQTPVENTVVFSQLYGANLIEQTPATTMLLDLFGAQLLIPVYNVTTYVLMAICALFLAATFGWQNVGVTYVLRNMVRGEPVFLMSDYFYAIKRNFKQGFFLGLMDFFFILLLGFDILYLMNSPVNFGNNLMFYGVCAIAILYFFMRLYIYLMQVTFEMSIRKILKNALIFTTLGIKRNLMAVVGIVAITALNLLLFPLFGATPLGIAIPLILPLLYYMAVCTFTTAYCAYPIIDRYMIAPYIKEESDTAPLEEE